MSQNINNISMNNFNNLCRTCSQSNDLVSIHENIYLLEMLSTSAQIQIQLNDELPKNICLNCIQNLNQAYSFISKCRTTDAAFRQCLTQQKLLNLRKNYEKQHKPNNKVQLTEEVIIKAENSDIDDYNDSVSDECSKDSKQPAIISQFENKSVTPPEINNSGDVCSNCNKSFATNTEFTLHLNDCRFNLIEPTELNESSEDEFHDDPLDVSSSSLPEKSRSRYKRERILFLMYCKQNKLKEFTEDVVLNYFLEKSKTMIASSLWSLYSMLKSTLILHDDVDISKYRKVLAFLKEKNAGYKSVVSKVFTREEIHRFLYEAPDETYLMMKVAMIMGIAGGCQRDELMRMSMDHIEDKDSVLIVTVPIPKTNNARTFLITNRESDWMFIYRKYYAYRSLLNTEHRRLFVNYKNGKFTNIPTGKNTLGRFPKLIAEYLNLADPALYTGHCFRRTSTMLFNKRGVWKSSVVLDGDDSQL